MMFGGNFKSCLINVQKKKEQGEFQEVKDIVKAPVVLEVICL